MISKTPNSFFFIGWALRSQLSTPVSLATAIRYFVVVWSSHTELSNQGGFDRVRGPFTVEDALIVLHVYSHDFFALVERLSEGRRHQILEKS